MEFKRLTASGCEAYERAMELYRTSFPRHERRTRGAQTAALEREAYQFNLIYDEKVWAGILLCWETADFIYVEHFAVSSELRNKRYGQRALELLGSRGKPVILEIDPPTDEVSVRRKSFYERAGYRVNDFPHVHPPYREGYEGHRLVVMSSPAPLSAAEYGVFRDYLNKVVMGQDSC